LDRDTAALLARFRRKFKKTKGCLVASWNQVEFSVLLCQDCQGYFLFVRRVGAEEGARGPCHESDTLAMLNLFAFGALELGPSFLDQLRAEGGGDA
jgi:hypothetical protein